MPSLPIGYCFFVVQLFHIIQVPVAKILRGHDDMVLCIDHTSLSILAAAQGGYSLNIILLPWDVRQDVTDFEDWQISVVRRARTIGFWDLFVRRGEQRHPSFMDRTMSLFATVSGPERPCVLYRSGNAFVLWVTVSP